MPWGSDLLVGSNSRQKQQLASIAKNMSIRRHLVCLIGLHIIFSVFATFAPGTLASDDMIVIGGNITDGNALVSEGGSFTLGFFSPPGDPTKRYLGTWFSSGSPEPDAMSIYWVANRDRPLNDTSGVLVLTNQGTLVLLDGSNNSTVWSSGSTSSSSPPTGARLLESGNFVVQGQDNGTAQWQSFDHPCNALLPGMKIGKNRWNGDEWYLSSWRAAADPGVGSYRYVTELGGGTPENVLRDDGSKRFRTGPWNGQRFDGVPEMASYASNSNFTPQVTVSPSEATYSFTARPGAPYSQVRLGEAGEVQRLVWDESSRQWNHFMKQPRDECDGYGYCGPFGLCDRDDASTSLCSCFSGFAPASPMEWSLREYSGGCRRSVPLDCGGNQSRSSSSTDGFQVVPLVKLPDTQNASVDMAVISLDECRLRCLANCSCVAYAAADNRAGGCITWTDSFTDLRFIEKGQDFYLRLPNSLLPAAAATGGKNKKKALIIVIIAVVVFGVASLLLLLAIVSWCLWRMKSRPAEDPSSAGHLIHYQILKDATANFSEDNKIGQGSFGKVYRCELPEHESTKALFRLPKIGLQAGKKVAVKVLNQSVMNKLERELKVLLGLSHVNLVRLLAYCNHDNGVLIYEYMEKGSLDHYVFGDEDDKRKQLSWTQRLQIITSVADGVWYLHVGSGRDIIHRDLKPANILLADDMMTPKIADFGLAKPVPDQTASHTPVGPLGYLAPECRKGKTSKKSDVYSFGVVLLEIISGIQNCAAVMERLHFPHARNYWNNENEGFTLLRDPKVPLSQEEADDPKFLPRLWRCIQIGLLCIQESPDKRPDIEAVLKLLKTECELPELEEPTLKLREDGEHQTQGAQMMTSNNLQFLF